MSSLACQGCGSTRSLEEIRSDGRAVSCCPERKLVPARCACGAMLELSRLWAGTCPDCMAAGCPRSPLDAEQGNPCDACDCVPPEMRRAR